MTELERIAAALDGAPGLPVLVSLLRVSGSAYRGPGARMVVMPDGSTVGAISGGCLEKDAVAHAEQARAAGTPRTVTWDLTRDDDKPWGLGMGCNATLDVRFEPCPDGTPGWLRSVLAAHRRREPITVETSPGTLESFPAPIMVVVCGEGADTEPLIRLAAATGWVARAVGKDDAIGALDARSAAVIMTHNYQRDLELLAQLLESDAPYIGVLGPRSRTSRLLEELRARGAPADTSRLARLRAPVGLDIGAETPEEIALAVAAEIRAVFAGRPGGALAQRAGPIHDR